MKTSPQQIVLDFCLIAPAPSACLATPSLSFLSLAPSFYTWFFVKTAIFQLSLKSIKLHLLFEQLEGLFKVVLNFNHYGQGYPPFLMRI